MIAAQTIDYQVEPTLSVVEFREVLISSGLGERRPVDNWARLEAMIQCANLLVTARRSGVLVGVARSLTDFSFATYLSDLAVDRAFQKQGIGKELIRRTKLVVPHTKLILLAAPAAIHYYGHVGMKRHEHCYWLDNDQNLSGPTSPI